MQAYGTLAAAFPARAETMDVVVSADPGDAGEVGRALAEAHRDAVSLGAATGDLDVAAAEDGRTHVLLLAARGDPSSEAAEDGLDTVRDVVVPDLRADLAAAGVTAEVGVGGSVAAGIDFARWIDGRLPLVVGFVLVLAFVVMALSFGSLALATATVALDLLSVAAAYGVLTLVFQGTWAEGLLGFTSTGTVVSWLPLMLFVVLFGLSMDYHVFVVSQVREAFTGGAAPRAAVVAGVARSAGVVTSAAVVMVVVFAVFGTLSLPALQQLGVGLAVAVLLDATVVRGVLLPAVLALLGRHAHRGPRWLPALHG